MRFTSLHLDGGSPKSTDKEKIPLPPHKAVKHPSFHSQNLAAAIPSQVERVPLDFLIENDFCEEPGDYRDLSWRVESRNQWLEDRIPNQLGSDVVQERIMNQAVFGSQILPLEMSAEPGETM